MLSAFLKFSIKAFKPSNKKTHFLKVLFLFLLFLNPVFIHADDLKSKELLDFVDDLYRSNSSYSTFTMFVKSKYFERELELEAWTSGKEKSLIKILQPNKEKNTTTLKVDNQIWNYLPKINKVIKVPSSMMASSWMGSHFSNDDLVKESRFSDDYNCKIKTEDKKSISFVCIPKENTVVVWGKVDVFLTLPSKMPIKMEYYDEDEKLVRTLKFEDVKQFKDKKVPATLRMIPEDKKGEETVITYKQLEFDLPIKKDLFSLKALRQKSKRF